MGEITPRKNGSRLWKVYIQIYVTQELGINKNTNANNIYQNKQNCFFTFTCNSETGDIALKNPYLLQTRESLYEKGCKQTQSGWTTEPSIDLVCYNM